VKKTICMFLIGLALLSFGSARMTAAGSSGPSANGDFQFSLVDGALRYIQFDVRTQKNGETKGQMTFNDPAAFVGSDGDGGSATSLVPGLFVTAEFDCLQIRGNAAVMSGVITQSNALNAIGERVLLVVEDNSEGIRAPSLDKLTWGVYRSSATGWIPSDAELEHDSGIGLTWLATDAEREDDTGISSNQSTTIGCRSFPLSSYTLVDVAHGFGNIQVRP
jgi:hypothetical protein